MDYIPIEDLKFSIRVCNSLKRAGINSKEDLERLDESDLDKVRNLGERGKKEIFSREDIKLKDEETRMRSAIPKAKYIQEKERTLFNDLDNAQKKLKQVANWYPLSDYDITAMDKKNFKLFIQNVNSIYFELGNLLLNTRNFELYEILKKLVTDEKLNDLSELEQKIQEVKIGELENGQL